MSNWNEKFIDLSDYVSKWSKDKRKKVGAVITDKDNRILSLGYNGIPQGCNDNDETRDIKPKKNYFFAHAEANAIYSCAKSGISTQDSTMYLSWYPCCNCTMAIIQSGIKRVVCIEPDWKDESWGDSFKYSKEMLDEAKIEVIYHKK